MVLGGFRSFYVLVLRPIMLIVHFGICLGGLLNDRSSERSQFRTLVVFRLTALVIFLKYISSGINTVMD